MRIWRRDDRYVATAFEGRSIPLRRMLTEVMDDQLSLNSTLPRTLGTLVARASIRPVGLLAKTTPPKAH